MSALLLLALPLCSRGSWHSHALWLFLRAVTLHRCGGKWRRTLTPCKSASLLYRLLHALQPHGAARALSSPRPTDACRGRNAIFVMHEPNKGDVRVVSRRVVWCHLLLPTHARATSPSRTYQEANETKNQAKTEPTAIDLKIYI